MITMALKGKIRALHEREGKSISEIARRTSLSRNTIKKWLRAPAQAQPKYRRAKSPGKLAPFVATLTQALKADAHRPKHERRTARALLVQLQAQGYNGGYSRLTDFIRNWRQGEGQAVLTTATLQKFISVEHLAGNRLSATRSFPNRQSATRSFLPRARWWSNRMKVAARGGSKCNPLLPPRCKAMLQVTNLWGLCHSWPCFVRLHVALRKPSGRSSLSWLLHAAPATRTARCQQKIWDSKQGMSRNLMAIGHGTCAMALSSEGVRRWPVAAARRLR